MNFENQYSEVDAFVCLICLIVCEGSIKGDTCRLFLPFSKYECVMKLWPILSLASTIPPFQSILKVGRHSPKIDLIE